MRTENSIHLHVSEDVPAPRVVNRSDQNITTPTSQEGIPKYIGATAKVEQLPDGAEIILSDYQGTTTAIVKDGQRGEKGDKGDKGDPGEVPFFYGTTAEWDAQTTLVSEKNAFYVYTDHAVVDGKYIPGMKLGDGLAYVVDLPFLDAVLTEHIDDTSIHVSAQDRAFWNNKNRGFVNGENLILTNN